MSAGRDGAVGVKELLSRAQIIELGAKYCVGIDRGDQTTFLSIWHPEGEYIIGSRRGRFCGLSELSQAITFVQQSYQSTHHWTTNHIVRLLDGERAEGSSDSFAICVGHDGLPSLVSASYEDQYLRLDGEWRIRTRIVRRWFVSEPMNLALLRPARIREE
ncbi:nuclear transport factor 2 family protein [Frankia tisae]|uniref:nuclear transport factor 2 family protein n=1 Tax=Frankia tisae TaxID=2950104 RepID=UPI0021C2250E|nr:nuclear transport factor 2 family protein [Frankia tisae]